MHVSCAFLPHLRDRFLLPGAEGLCSETLCGAQSPNTLLAAQAASRVRRWASLQSRPLAQHHLSLLGPLPVGAGRDASPRQRHRLLEKLTLVREVGDPTDGPQNLFMETAEGREDGRRQTEPERASCPDVRGNPGKCT